ncbi:MAG: hypothetical protein ACREYE_19920 [Gammaproteobacteria bacterium]
MKKSVALGISRSGGARTGGWRLEAGGWRSPVSGLRSQVSGPPLRQNARSLRSRRFFHSSQHARLSGSV